MSDPVVKLVARYVKAQEKRAAVEVGQFIKSADNHFHVRLSHNLSKRAFGENALQYLSDIVNSTKEHGNNFAKNVPAGISMLKEKAKNPINAALMGGLAGGVAGTGAGLVSGSNVLGKALQGGVAGATLGGGLSLAGNAMGSRGGDAALENQVAELTGAIDSAQDAGGTHYGLAAGGLSAGMKGVNLADNVLSGMNPASVLAGENMNTMTDRLNLIKRLENWRGTGKDSKRIGGDSIDAFIDILNKTDNPQGARALFANLQKQLGGADGISKANLLLQGPTVGGGKDIDISTIVRAIKESREGGFQFLPSNMLGRSQGVLNRLGIKADHKTWRPLQWMNSALSRPFGGGRTGLIGAIAGTGLAGAYDMYNNSNEGGSVDPETIQAIRDQLNAQ